MKNYIKPFIEDEEIEIEDICVPSGPEGPMSSPEDEFSDGGDSITL